MNPVYKLKVKDKLFGEPGHLISERVYMVLPLIDKKKFEKALDFKKGKPMAIPDEDYYPVDNNDQFFDEDDDDDN